MLLEGSCHCGAVRFSVESEHPYPFNLCYCSICRKTAGAGGFAINLGGRFRSLKVDGEQHIRVYRARVEDAGDGTSLSPHLVNPLWSACRIRSWRRRYRGSSRVRELRGLAARGA
jgi:hypothetical protein